MLRSLISCCLLLHACHLFAQESDTSGVPCYLLREITVSGDHKTKDAIIFRELSISPGDCLPADSVDYILEFNRLRLMNINLFNEVAMHPRMAGDTLYLDLTVLDRFPVMPEPNLEFADRNFNVWWTEMNRDLRRINLGLTLNHYNFRGNRETVGLTAQVGYTQKLGLSYSRPFADKQQKHGFGVSFFGLQNREIAFKTDTNKLHFARHFDNFMQRRFDAAVWYTYRPAYAVTHLAQLSFHHYWISDTVREMNPEYLGDNRNEQDVVKLAYRFEYNGVDNWNYPLTGNRFIGLFEQKFALSGTYWQTSVNLHYDHYFNPWKKWYGSLVLRARTSMPQRQPYIFRQNLGYDFDYIRGYEYYVLDGTSFALARGSWKYALLDMKIHLPIRFFQVIPIRVYGKVYGDVGAGYNPEPEVVHDYLSNKLLYSGGVGIDIITLYDIKIRIEYTVNHLGEKSLYLHRSGE